MNDELFGNIEYDFQWMGKCALPIFGQGAAVTLSIPCDEGDEIAASQRKAFAAFQERKDALGALAEKAILEYYQDALPECRARLGPDLADQLAPEIATLREIGRLVTLTEVIIQRSFTDPPERVVGLLFDCSWDTSLGLAVKFINERLSGVGTQDIVL